MSAGADHAALRVLANRSLLPSITAFSSGISFSIYQVKQQLVCASDAYDKYKNGPEDMDLWQNAIISGDIQTLEALRVLSQTPVLGKRLQKLLSGIFAYTLTHTKNLALLDWVHGSFALGSRHRHRNNCSEEDRELGAQGDVEVIRWLLSRRYRLSVNIVSGAASNGQLGLLQYLHEAREEPFGCVVELIKAAAANGHVTVVRFLHENRPPCRHRADYHRNYGPSSMDQAAVKGYLEVVKFLHETKLDTCSQAAMDGAAANGHLEVVHFLHENRDEGCTHRAVEDAIMNNHIEIVTFLRENRSEGCSREAMEDAIEHDDLELLKRLCENRGVGSLEGALQFAAKRGQVKLVRFLFEATPSFLPREELVNHAATHGHVELVKFFHEHADFFRFSAMAMHNAAVANHRHIVKFLHENRQEGCKVDTLFEGHTRIVDFLLKHRRVENVERSIARAKREDRPLLAAKLAHNNTSRTATTKTYAYKQ